MAVSKMNQPEVTLRYPIPHDDSGGCLFVYGKADAPHLVIMFPGFPDDQSVFQPLAARIAASCNCLVGVGCLPGYDDEKEENVLWKDGYSFEEWVASLREAARVLRAHSKHTDAKLTGVFHDWGCLAGVMYTNACIKENLKELIPDQLVLFDVLLRPHPKTVDIPQVKLPILTKLHTVIALASYQLVLAKTWFLKRYVSKFLALIYLAFATPILELLRLSPAATADVWHYIPRSWHKAERIPYMTYPYFRLWKAILTGNLRTVAGGAFLPLDLKQTPILYMYGASKKVQLHSYKSLALLEKQEGAGRSRIVRVEKAGHWLYLQQPDQCFEEVKRFLLELTKSSRL